MIGRWRKPTKNENLFEDENDNENFFDVDRKNIL